MLISEPKKCVPPKQAEYIPEKGRMHLNCIRKKVLPMILQPAICPLYENAEGKTRFGITTPIIKLNNVSSNSKTFAPIVRPLHLHKLSKLSGLVEGSIFQQKD